MYSICLAYKGLTTILKQHGELYVIYLIPQIEKVLLYVVPDRLTYTKRGPSSVVLPEVSRFPRSPGKVPFSELTVWEILQTSKQMIHDLRPCRNI